MVKSLLVVWVVVAAAIGLAAAAVPSVEVDGGLLSLLGLAIVFGLVNALVGTLLRLVTLPLTLMTFGLFGLVVNGILLAITAGLTDVLDVGGFFATVAAAFLVSLFSAVLLFLTNRLLFRAPRSATA